MLDTREEQKRLLTVGEVALVLRVSPRYVYSLVEDGRLPALRIGSGSRAPWRVDPVDLRDFLLAANREDG